MKRNASTWKHWKHTHFHSQSLLLCCIAPVLCVCRLCVSLNQTKTSGTQVTDFLFAFEIHVHYICDEQKNMLSMIVSYIYNVIEFYQFTTALDVSINLCHVHFIHSKCSRPPNMLLFVLGFNRDTRLKVVANKVHAFMRYNWFDYLLLLWIESYQNWFLYCVCAKTFTEHKWNDKW